MTTNEQHQIDSLVTNEWLSQHLDDPDLVVLDCTVAVLPDPETGFRIASGRPDYDKVHIPGAGFAEMLTDLSSPDKPEWWVPIPTPERFCNAMGALGVGDDSRVVLYDGNGRMWSARVWWMLRWVGFDNVALLDGGLDAWMAEGRPLSTAPANRPAKQLTPRVRPGLIADRDEILAAIEEGLVDDGAVCIIDTLGASSYEAQHIPGASSLNALDLVDESGRYLLHDKLAEMHNGDRNARTITYCGGGVAASSNAFVMARLGYTNVAVYMASMQEWAADPANPIVVGTD